MPVQLTGSSRWHLRSFWWVSSSRCARVDAGGQKNWGIKVDIPLAAWEEQFQAFPLRLQISQDLPLKGKRMESSIDSLTPTWRSIFTEGAFSVFAFHKLQLGLCTHFVFKIPVETTQVILECHQNMNWCQGSMLKRFRWTVLTSLYVSVAWVGSGTYGQSSVYNAGAFFFLPKSSIYFWTEWNFLKIILKCFKGSLLYSHVLNYWHG